MQPEYTYYGGQKVSLRKREDEFVVRAVPEALDAAGFGDVERTSAHSFRVYASPAELEREMSKARQLGPTHHAYETAADGQEFLITDRVFVLFRTGTSNEEIDALAGRYGLVQLEAYSDLDRRYQLTAATGMNPVKLVVKLAESEAIVARAEHDLNHRMTKYAFVPPTDPFYLRQWHLHSRQAVAADYDPRSSANVEAAWALLGHAGRAEVTVGITDDGCQLSHRDFDSSGKVADWAGYRLNSLGALRFFRRDDPGAQPDSMYVSGDDHGTSCAGVIAAELDGVLTVGAAPDCRILPVKWHVVRPEGYLAIDDGRMRQALRFVADKVDVLSNSWGGRPTTLWSAAVLDDIRALAQTGGRRGRGIVFLWAAGNENCPIVHDGNVEAPYTNGWEYNGFTDTWIWTGAQTSRRFTNNLVGIPGVMHVGALSSAAQRSHYSNYGKGLSLCAPTSNGHSYFRARVVGRGVTTATGDSTGVTEAFGGTSSATPLVAGIAALVISANPLLTAVDVVSILQRTASKDLSMAGYPRTPPAAYDPNPAWDVSPIAPYHHGAFQDVGHPDGTWSPWFGHGRVDAEAAVRAALAVAPAPTAPARGPQLANLNRRRATRRRAVR